jgi:hypothetical protein
MNYSGLVAGQYAVGSLVQVQPLDYKELSRLSSASRIRYVRKLVEEFCKGKRSPQEADAVERTTQVAQKLADNELARLVRKTKAHKRMLQTEAKIILNARRALVVL